MKTIDAPSNARSQRTRTAVLSAARAILEEDGFRRLTMEAVAQRAGVTRRSVYLHYASRAELVLGLFDYLAETEGLQRSLSTVWAAEGAEDVLDAWAAHVARYHPRLIAVDRAVAVESRHDPDARAHRARSLQARTRSARRVIDRLAGEGRLADTWDRASATDMLLALDSSDLIHHLLTERGWSAKRFTAHYRRLLRRTFLNHPPEDRS
jgi:AcrR family transcriptional regulator